MPEISRFFPVFPGFPVPGFSRSSRFFPGFSGFGSRRFQRFPMYFNGLCGFPTFQVFPVFSRFRENLGIPERPKFPGKNGNAPLKGGFPVREISGRCPGGKFSGGRMMVMPLDRARIAYTRFFWQGKGSIAMARKKSLYEHKNGLRNDFLSTMRVCDCFVMEMMA